MLPLLIKGLQQVREFQKIWEAISRTRTSIATTFLKKLPKPESSRVSSGPCANLKDALFCLFSTNSVVRPHPYNMERPGKQFEYFGKS